MPSPLAQAYHPHTEPCCAALCRAVLRCAPHVQEADKELIARIKAAGRLVDHGAIMHSYPFCWRSDTPLIYKVRLHPSP